MVKKSPNQTKKFLALDLELTQPSEKIIQVGVCVGSIEQPESEWIKRVWYLDPKEPLSEFITQLTGITDQDIKQYAVSHEQLAQELSELIVAEQVFVNPVVWGGGDSLELLAEFKTRNIEFKHFGRRWIDTKTFNIFLRLAEGKSPSGGLKSAMGGFKLHFKGEAHRADVDAYNTLRFFFFLINRQSKLESLASDAKEI